MTRLTVSDIDLPAFLREGWRIVRSEPCPMRGTDWLIELEHAK